MRWSKVYRGVFRNMESDPVTNLSLDVDIQIDIYDTTSTPASDPTEIIVLEMADNPCSIETVDNEEDKFKTVIRSKRGVINIFSSDSLGIETFIDGGDHRFFCDITGPAHTFLSGYISVADIQEDFQPDPNVLTLICTDGLGFAEDKDLVDFDGNTPSGIKKIGIILQWALQAGTGYANSLQAALNIRDESASTLTADIAAPSGDGHFFMFNYLDLRTFEGDNPGTRLSCAEVIRRILFSLGAELSQQGGIWRIKRIDEMQGDSSQYYAEFNETGDFVSWTTLTTGDFIKSIGEGLSLSWMNDDAVVSADRPLRRIELKRTYDFFSEIPCNVDFERGEGSEPTGAADETIDYTLECWRFLREGTVPADLDSQPFAGSVGLLRKRFVYNYEVDRYLISQVAGGFRHYFKSEGIYCGLKEKFQIGINYRFSNDIGSATINIMHIRLLGSDGNIYDLSRTTANVQAWHQKLSTAPVFDDTIQDDIAAATDTTEWHSFSFETIPAPVSGTLYIRLLNDLASPVGRDFSALTIDPRPLINGTYGKFTGEQDSIEQTGDNIALRQDDIYLGTGPDMNVKGCILKRGTDTELYSGTANFGTSQDIQMTGDHRNVFFEGQEIIITGSGSGNNLTGNVVSVSYSIIGDTTTIITDMTFTLEVGATVVIYLINYIAANLFFSAAVFPSGVPDPSYLHPFGYIIAFDFWNQYNRVMRKFDGTVDGLNSDADPVDMIYLYSLTDVNPNTGSRVFMILHYTQDLHLCEMNVLLIEVHDPGQGKQYLGHQFKYLTQ